MKKLGFFYTMLLSLLGTVKDKKCTAEKFKIFQFNIFADFFEGGI